PRRRRPERRGAGRARCSNAAGRPRCGGRWIRRASGVVAVRSLERHGLGALGFLQQDLDFLLGVLERLLTLARQLHAALEFLERVLERQLAAFEPLDDCLELLQTLLDAAEALVFQAHLQSNARIWSAHGTKHGRVGQTLYEVGRLHALG